MTLNNYKCKGSIQLALLIFAAMTLPAFSQESQSKHPTPAAPATTVGTSTSSAPPVSEQKTNPDEKGTTQQAPKSGADASNVGQTVESAGASKPATPAKVKAEEPKLPSGFDAAVKSFNAGKYPYATKQFETFIKAGANDEKIHSYLAQCYYKTRIYSKAIKEYDWLAKNCKHNDSLKDYASESARTLKFYMAGVCPGNCLKANDPRWQDQPGHPGKWIKFDVDSRIWGYPARYISSDHIGHVLTFYKTDPRIGDICPICHGTGRVRVLKDGDPL